jgi:hypothetical protein
VEYFVVRVRTVLGKRSAVRRKLQIPWECAVGEYERLSDRALNDLIKDLWHEQRRREGYLVQPARRWNPMNTQITNPEEDE